MTGAVYDRGYRPYEGVRGGRKAARTALLRASLRRALGIRRDWRQKVAPFALLAIAVVPAVVNVGVRYLTRNTPAASIEFLSYRDYVGVSNSLLVFVALTAPDILCPDRRQRVLSLIFARPLMGVDYIAAKVGTMASILFAFSVIPQLVLFVGQMLVSEEGSLRYLQDNVDVLWRVPIAAGLLSLYYAIIGAAISSLTSRRIIAGASIVGLFLITSAVSSILVGPSTQSGQETQTPNASVVTETRHDPSAAPLLNLAGLPLVLRDVVFLGEIDSEHPMSGLSNGGLMAGGAYALVVGAGLGTLLFRYRVVEQ